MATKHSVTPIFTMPSWHNPAALQLPNWPARRRNSAILDFPEGFPDPSEMAAPRHGDLVGQALQLPLAGAGGVQVAGKAGPVNAKGFCLALVHPGAFQPGKQAIKPALEAADGRFQVLIALSISGVSGGLAVPRSSPSFY